MGLIKQMKITNTLLAATVFIASASATRLPTQYAEFEEGEFDTSNPEGPAPPLPENVNDTDALPEAEGDRQSNEFNAMSFKQHFRDAVAYHGTIGYNYREDEFLYNTLHAIDKNKDGELSIDEYEAFVDLMLNI